MFIRGHKQRSLDPFIFAWIVTSQTVSRLLMNTIQQWIAHAAPKKRMVREENKRRKVKGTAVCVNPTCPRRQICRSTTVNGARNIIILSYLASKDGLLLPPYRKGQNNSNYVYNNLKPLYIPLFNTSYLTFAAHSSLATLRTPADLGIWRAEAMSSHVCQIFRWLRLYISGELISAHPLLALSPFLNTKSNHVHFRKGKEPVYPNPIMSTRFLTLFTQKKKN